MVASHLVVQFAFTDGQAADFAAPMHDRRVEQAPLLEIGYQGGRRLVGAAADRGQRSAQLFREVSVRM